jgi:transglutaminase-like putative cysteine protease
MSGFPADARRDLPLAVVAAATTWVTMLSWRGFSSLWGQYLGPLLLVGVVVAFGGVLLRSAPLPRRLALLLHILVVALIVWLMMGGSLLHPVHGAHNVANSLADAWTSSETYQPPVPANVPGIAPMMIPCGALSLLVVDLLACWLRRVSLAGLPLLAIYCVPISLLGSGVSWLVFLVAAVGFLLMMYLQEAAHITRWGRPLGSSAASVDPQGFGVSTGASKTSAGAVGGAAVVLAVILPVFIPTLHLDGLGLFGPGGSGGSGVKVVNPIIDMRRDLYRGSNVPLLDMTTDDPDPSYLRIAVLTQYNGFEWTAGNRQIISDQTASGLVPLEFPGLSNNIPVDSYNYKVTATSDFQSLWLPTQFPVSDINADGNWHYDTTTMDFLSGNHATTAGLTYTMTAAKPELSGFAMARSLTAPLAIQSAYTALPSSLPPSVGDMARKVTTGAESRYEQAVMLQRWFRDTGGFRYSLQRHQDDGNGNSALLRFLNRGPDGRTGYCEQFASAFAVMARTLDIPARVSVGFLDPHPGAAKGEWVYKAHDLHAWPELYFQGSGWVRFEPTPGTRAATTPVYTHGAVRNPTDPKSNQTQGGKVPTESASATTKQPHNQTSSTRSSSGTDIPWTRLLLGLGILLVLAGIATVPGLVRRSRRTRRLAGGAEDGWAELRDSAVDLGVSWPSGRSPHETGHFLAAWFGPEPDGPPLVRPPRGRGLAPGAEDALDRIVLTVEQVRYARDPRDVPGALADDVLACIAALEHGSTGSTLRRAKWLPRSLFGGRRGAAARAGRDREPEAVAAGGVVDHVG